jgi:hypothetical protein
MLPLPFCPVLDALHNQHQLLRQRRLWVQHVQLPLLQCRLHSLDKPALLLQQQQVAQADLNTEEMPTRVEKGFILTFDVIQTDCTVHAAQDACKNCGVIKVYCLGLITTARVGS